MPEGRLDPERTPVVVAAGQAESRDLSLGPLELAEAAAAEALEAAPGLGAAIERLSVVNILVRQAGPAPASDLAGRLGLRPSRCETTTIGGNTPQLLVERAAADIAAGELAASLVVGAEAVRSGRLKPGGSAEAPSAPPRHTEASVPDAVVGRYRQDLSDEERAASLMVPVFVYPLFESVLAERAGRSPHQQRQVIGELMERFSAVASRNPHAWFTEPLDAAAISTPSPDNRLVAEPYTKRMVAFLGGAQGAALVVTSLAEARRQGLADGAMFIWAAASAEDVWYPVERPDLGRAEGFELAARAALQAAGITADDVAVFDLYSCFPSAVQIAAEALGIAAGDERPLTVTGGLPYFGGPGNNYVTHALAALLAELRARQDGDAVGLVNGVSWYLTKHSVGVYSTAPPPAGGFRAPHPAELAEAQARIHAGARSRVTSDDPLSQPAHATVEASTVLYARDGTPTAAPVVATIDPSSEEAPGGRVAAAAADGEASQAAGHFLNGARIQLEPGKAPTDPPTYRIVDKE